MLHLRPDRSRANAPYRDRIEDDGRVLIYEGHDFAKNATTLIQNRSISRDTPLSRLRDELELRLGRRVPGPSACPSSSMNGDQRLTIFGRQTITSCSLEK